MVQVSCVSTVTSSRTVAQPTNTTVATGLTRAVVETIRSILGQGLKIGTEHADKRRFRTNSWKSCSPISSNRESEVIAAVEGCLAEHQGEYVRLLGIDTRAKRRVVEETIQRP